EAPAYRHVIPEVLADLDGLVTAAVAEGIDMERIVIDPGIGFGKRASDNLAIMRHLAAFGSLRRPVAVGVSRKSFLAGMTSDKGPATAERADSTLVAETCCVLGGAHILRTHDPARAARAARLAGAVSGHLDPGDPAAPH
ncbi:MAG TPA: dihydropteroate synthase, partial [Candidatus Polarisedimenticolia bacterium]|nr:dihydropteroate synthase [Candidatus Polarisedimenticolia bacterium]